jgi:hypothetical protein
VSAEQARKVYRVALDPNGGGVDREKTKRLRAGKPVQGKSASARRAKAPRARTTARRSTARG